MRYSHLLVLHSTTTSTSIFLVSGLSPIQNDYENDEVDLTIDDIARETLNRAVGKIPDGSAVITTSAEDRLEYYKDISALPVLQKDGNRLSGILQHGAFDFPSVDGNLRTKVSYAVSSCICLDWLCEKTASIDMRGVEQIDNGELRGASPIIFHNKTTSSQYDDNYAHLPCLAAYKSPVLNEEEIFFDGCDFVPSPNAPPFFVENCLDGRVENLQLLDVQDNDELIGRPLTGWEVLPDNTEDIEDLPYHTLDMFINSFDVPEKLLFEDWQFAGFNFEVDISPLLEEIGSTVAKSAFDAIGQALRPWDFPPGQNFTDARFEEIIRILDRFSNVRLVSSLTIPEDDDDIRGIVGSSSLYRDLVGSVPETSPLQEILSGIVLLNLAAALLGRAIGLLCAEIKQDGERMRIITLCFAVFGSFAVLATESIAYYLRVSAEIDQNYFQESMVITTVVGGGRFGGLGFLRIGQDFDPFIVATYVIEVSDASSDYIPLLGWCYLSAIVFFVGSLIFSYKVAAQ